MAAGGPSFREPRRSEPAPRCAGARGAASLRGSAQAGGENNGPPQHSRSAWGRSSPMGTQRQRPTTAGLGGRGGGYGRTHPPEAHGKGEKASRVLGDITNVSGQRNAGKVLKSSQSARAVGQAKEPAAPKVPAAVPAPAVEAVPVAALPDAPSPARPEDLEPFPCEEGLEVQRVGEYAHDIFEQFFQEEAAVQPIPYMEVQPDINGKMRAILVDWLVEVHMKYRLRQAVLFLTINLIDRYLSCGPPISRKKLQLVGVVAMFVASKFEEIEPPTVHNFVYITDNAYTKEEVLQAECSMLATLGFRIVVPTADEFLDRLLRAHCCDSRHRSLARYLLELAMIDIKWLRYRASQIAAAALLLSNELLGQRTSWPASLARCARYTEASLRPCVADLQALLEAAPKSSLQAVRKKFASRENHSVASICPTVPAPAA